MHRNQKILLAIARWASRHPRPDEPMVLTGAGKLSPRQIAREIKEQTGTGVLLLRVVEHCAKRQSLKAVLEAFNSPTPEVTH